MLELCCLGNNSLFAQYVCQSSQTVSDGLVCLCKFHHDLTNDLKFNMQVILQRGGVLTFLEQIVIVL